MITNRWTIPQLEESFLETYARCVKKAAKKTFKAPCNRWRKGAFESLSGEIIELSNLMREASAGAIIEYECVLGFIDEYFATKHGLLTREELNDQREIARLVGLDIAIFERNYKRLPYTRGELQAIEQARNSIMRLHSRLQMTRPA